MLSIDGVCDVHHIHIWSMDGYKNGATFHVVTDSDFVTVKKNVKEELKEHSISHSTVECECVDEVCTNLHCQHEKHEHGHGHHHHHH